jgi:hypothetical protein
MGLLGAFATGMVKGFTQNIKEEKAKRLADEQNLKTLEGAVIQASLSGDDYIAQNGDAVMKAIKAARGELDEKEAIDLFGTETPRVNIDETKLLGNFIGGSADDVNMYIYKEFGPHMEQYLKVSDPDDKLIYERTKPLYNYQLLQTLEQQIQLHSSNAKTAEERNRFFEALSNPQTKMAFSKNFISIFDSAKIHQNSIPKDKQFVGQFKGTQQKNIPSFDWVSKNMLPMGQYPNFESDLGSVPQLSQSIVGSGNVTEQAIVSQASGDPFIISGEAYIPELNNVSLRLANGNNLISGNILGLDEIDSPKRAEQMQGLENIARIKGYTGSRYNPKLGAKYVIFDISKNPNIATEEQLKTKIKQIAEIGNVIGTSKITSLSGTQQLELVEYLLKQTDGNIDLMAHAEMIEDIVDNPKVQQSIDFETDPAAVNTIEVTNFSDTFKELAGTSYEKFTQKKKNLDLTVSQIDRLQDARKRVGLSSQGVLKGVFGFAEDVVGPTGLISQLTNKFQLDPEEQGVLERHTERQQELYRKQGYTDEDLSFATARGRIIALEIALTANVARSVEEGGRLSDFDMQQASKRVIGVAGGSLETQKEALMTLRREMVLEQKKHEQIELMANTVRNRKFITQKQRNKLVAMGVVSSLYAKARLNMGELEKAEFEIKKLTVDDVKNIQNIEDVTNNFMELNQNNPNLKIPDDAEFFYDSLAEKPMTYMIFDGKVFPFDSMLYAQMVVGQKTFPDLIGATTQ